MRRLRCQFLTDALLEHLETARVVVNPGAAQGKTSEAALAEEYAMLAAEAT